MAAPREQDDRAPRTAGRQRARRALLGLIGLLYLVSVPWYRASGGELRLVAGLPDWVALAIACYVAVAVLNSLAWSLTDIDDRGPLPDTLEGGEGAPRSRTGP